MGKEVTGGSLFWKDLQGELDADPASRAAFALSLHTIASIDDVVNGIDERRRKAGLSKAALARRAGMRDAAVRRLFTASDTNPTLRTAATLAAALGLRLTVEPMARGERVEIDRLFAIAAANSEPAPLPAKRRTGRTATRT